MAKLSNEAFAVMAMCPKTKKDYGITVDPRGGKTYAFCWGFKMKQGQGKREQYDAKTVKGAVVFDEDFNGCPYCGTKRFYYCNSCGRWICWHGEEVVTCPCCGISSTLTFSKKLEFRGGGM